MVFNRLFQTPRSWRNRVNYEQRAKRWGKESNSAFLFPISPTCHSLVSRLDFHETRHMSAILHCVPWAVLNISLCNDVFLLQRARVFLATSVSRVPLQFYLLRKRRKKYYTVSGRLIGDNKKP